MNANLTHYSVGQKVRKTIEELGGTMPEDLPSADAIHKAKNRINNTSAKRIKEK